MVTIQSFSRRVAFAFAIALAIAAGPAVAVLAGAAGAPRVVAEPDCTASDSSGDSELSCAPDTVAPEGAPSEEEVTEDNPGIASPTHMGR